MRDYRLTGYVYFIQAGNDPAVKIGSTINSLELRLKALQNANHRRLKLIGAIDLSKLQDFENYNRIEYSQLAMAKEQEIHRRFSGNRIHGEWFELTDALLVYINQHSNHEELTII